MHRFRTNGEKVFNVFNIAFLSLVTLIMFYPMWHILTSSLSDPHQLWAHTGVMLRPLGWNPAAYVMVLNNPNILTGYINTIFVVLVGTSIQMIMTICCAFALTRRDFMLKKPMTMLILFTFFFQGGLIPTFLVVQGVGLIDTRFALIFPIAISTWNMIIMRTSFANFPHEMEDAARIDGAGELTFICRILLPLSKSVLAVIALFYAVHHWNAWLSSVLYLRTRSLFPLQLVMREILIAMDLGRMIEEADVIEYLMVGATIRYATIIVAVLPVLLFYPFVQRYFVTGIMIGAVKG